MAVMTSRIASGKKIEPQLIKSVNGNSEIKGNFSNLNFSPESLDIIRQGMFLSVNNQKGTAYKARILSSEQIMASKTGTSQVRRISLAERETGVLTNEQLLGNSVTMQYLLLMHLSKIHNMLFLLLLSMEAVVPK